MNFIRQNMFLVILVGVVVVVGGGMFAVYSGMAGDVEEAVAQRVTSAGELSGLANRRPKVNADVTKAKVDSALYAHAVDKALYDQHIAHNARRFRVLELPLYDTNTGKLLLGSADVAWPALMKALHAAAKDDKAMPAGARRMAGHIWQAIPEDVRKAMPPEGQPLNEDQQRALLGALNVIVQQADFYQPGDYDATGLQFPDAVERILRQRSRAARAAKDEDEEVRFDPLQAQRLNRMVLAAFLPQAFAPCQIPAFPIDERKYRQYALKFHFVQQYQQAMVALLDGLRPTRPPTDEEIGAAVLLWEKEIIKIEQHERRLRAKKEADARKNPRPTTPLAPGGRPIGPGGIGDPELEGPGMYGEIYGGRDLGRYAVRGKATGGGKGELKLDPKALGALNARMGRAKVGQIYADAVSLGLQFPLDETTSTSPTNLELWQAQVGLWVTQDLIESVRLTNEAGLAGVPDKERDVLKAPIKQVVGIEISAFGSGGKDGRVARPTAPPDLMLGGLGGRSSRGRAPVAAVPAADSLTMRASTTEYDIAQYSMTVVMGPQHLRQLQKNLLALNYHVILGVSMQEVPPEYDKLYYFGPQRGMLVTIEGELPLLADWTRGKQDKKSRTWLAWNRAPRTREAPRPNWIEGAPLMPVNVLSSMVIPQGALRPEDTERIRKAMGATGLSPIR